MSLVVRLLFLVQLLLNLAYVAADVSILKPSGDETYKPNADGKTISIELVWKDSVDLPSVSSMETFTFTLLYGSNTDMDPIDKLEDVPMSRIQQENSQFSYTARFSTAKLGNGQFFIQVYAASKQIGSTIHYSPRFMISSVSGGVATLTYTAATMPQPEFHVQNSGIDTRSHTVPYTMQTGIRRYAPMQQQPGSAVTVTTWSRRFPTSSVSYYSTFRPTLDQLTTYTPGWSYSMKSDYNYATPAPFPSDNGGWYNPKDRMTLTARKLNNKRR